jgi:hypothetical protein
VLPQPHKQLRALDALDHFPSSREHATGGCHTPGRTLPPPSSHAERLAPQKAATYPIRIPVRLPRTAPGDQAFPIGLPLGRRSAGRP